MAQQDNWWESDPVETASPAADSGVIYSPPKEPKEPKTTYRPLPTGEAATRGLPTNKPYQISSEGKVEAVPGATEKTATEIEAANKKAGEQKRANTVRALLGPVKDLYESNIKGQPATRAFGATEYADVLPSNEEFSVAARGILPLIRPLVAQSAKEGDSDKEMTIFEAYIPHNDDSDRAIERKFTMLETLIGGMVDGKSPSEILAEQGGEEGKDAQDSIVPDGAYVKDGGLYDKAGKYLGLAVNMPDGPFYPDGGGMSDSPDGKTPPDSDGYWSQIGQGLAQGAGSIVEGAASIPGIIVDPLATSLGRALGYKDYTSNFGERVRQDLGLPDNPDKLGGAIIQGGTAALSGAGLARGASAIAGSAPVRQALTTLGATPIRDVAAGAGAGGGGHIGEQIGGTPGQVIGTLAGGLGGYGASGTIARRALGERRPNTIMQAAEQFGVDVIPADVGGVGSRMASGAIGRTLGGIPLAEGAEKSIASAGKARDRLASEIGDVADEAGAGQAARRGFEEFKQTSKSRADDLYGKVSVKPDAKVQLGNTRGALAEVTRGMESNPELSKLWANHPRLRATLEALTPKDLAPQGREAFAAASRELTEAQTNYRRVLSAVSSPADQNAARQAVDAAQAKVEAANKLASSAPQGGELSWQDMNRFRSIVGEIIGQPGIKRDGNEIAALRKLYGALSSDMEVTAAQAGPKALQEFNRANQYWRGREGRIDDVFSTLFGNRDQKSDEAVFRQINTWAQSRTGDFSRLARTIRSMPEDEAATIRATVIDRMGQAAPSKQQGAGEVFSPAEFATQWHSLSDRAKTVLFPNKAHRENLDKFSMLMDNMKRAGEYQNFSNTALAGNAAALGLTSLGGGLPGVIVAGSLAGGSFALGKLLSSPRFARIIASTSEMPVEVANRKLSEQLAVIATREPMLAADARGLQQYLSQTLNQSPVRAAASEEETNGRREPVK